jgi:hypothetical protein
MASQAQPHAFNDVGRGGSNKPVATVRFGPPPRVGGSPHPTRIFSATSSSLGDRQKGPLGWGGSNTEREEKPEVVLAQGSPKG